MTSATASALRSGGRSDVSRISATAGHLNSVSAERFYQRPQHVERGLLGRWVRAVELLGVLRERKEVLTGEAVEGTSGQPLCRPSNVAQREVKNIQRNHEVGAFAARG